MTQLLDARPVCRPDLVLGPAILRGPRPRYVVKDPVVGRCYEVGDREHFVMVRLDGTRSLADVGTEYAAHFGRRLGAGAWTQLLGLLAGRGLLVGTDPRPAPSTAPVRRRLLGTVTFGNPTTLVDRVRRRIGFLLTPWALLPLLAAVAVLVVLLAPRVPELAHQARVMSIHPELGMLVVGAMWVSSVLHELAHALVCRHFGGTVSEIGMRWGFVFYCKISDVALFTSRWQRAGTAIAGAVANLVFLLPFALLWSLLPDGDVTRGGVAALLLVGGGMAVLNVLPIPNLDGYVALGHVLSVSDLCGEARRYAGLALRRRRESTAPYPRWLRGTYLCYLIGSTAIVAALVAAGVLLVGRLQPPTVGHVAAVAVLVAIGALAVARCLGLGATEAGQRQANGD